MRVVIIAALATVASGLGFGASAQASSIEHIVTGTNTAPSVVMVTCATCPPVSSIKEAPVSAGPVLAEGTQKIQVRTVNGKKELVRTEAWMGGSPVVFVNKQAGWLDNGSQLAGMPSDGVDKSTETGAVHPDVLAEGTMPLRLK
jgi:hypothetical protein